MTDMHLTYQIGITTISKIVRQVCRIIWKELSEECFPKANHTQWKSIADKFFAHAQFPNCIGAIDGKHVRVIQPEQSGSLYFNYKKYFSLVLLAMCDSDYNFTYINVGSHGSNSDSAIFQQSQLYTQLENKTLDVPEPQPLPPINEDASNTSQTRPKVPFIIVGDEAFALSVHVMRPYARRDLSYKKRIYNYRQCRARRLIECSFGILSNKFRIYHRPMNVKMDLAVSIVKTTCVLHNYIRKRDGYVVNHTFKSSGLVDLPRDLRRPNEGRSSSYAIRDIFTDYFISDEGKVSWQDRYIF